MVKTSECILQVEGLKTYLPIRKGLLGRTVGYVKAVDGVSFAIRAGQTLGLVGESGCGKTTVARSIVRLVPATEGRVFFDQVDVLSAGRGQLRQIRRQMSLIFQDPYGSLNPRMTVGNMIGEPLKVHKRITGKELQERVGVLLSKVGLSPEHINRYPHEFSGGQRQRIAIARALALGPKLVICDEPVSALDVSVQAQILNLLKDLQDEFGLTYLLIAHDLAVVEFACDVVAVMYMGRIVEMAPSQELYDNPLHPYTCVLMSAIPQVDPLQRGRRTASAEAAPGVFEPAAGCAFGPRCPVADDVCRKQIPSLEQKGGCKEHLVACRQCQ
ncbi:MAG: ABC transporter ATP-binding protein [Planctomycetota bacterium]